MQQLLRLWTSLAYTQLEISNEHEWCKPCIAVNPGLLWRAFQKICCIIHSSSILELWNQSRENLDWMMTPSIRFPPAWTESCWVICPPNTQKHKKPNLVSYCILNADRRTRVLSYVLFHHNVFHLLEIVSGMRLLTIIFSRYSYYERSWCFI